MPSQEQIEMSRYQRELEHDVQHLVKKYCRIMSWDIPELDEKEASRLILDALQTAVNDTVKAHTPT
ncbi:hypothetical protein F2Q65_13725 [Thiohalocapsa marina]|uniref:Uncharacterized protein n=1 Tax=Thiohalocapsa marina TaxID=424902 RepID=A0A5M8FLM2_9GAMM|nr:hypothetical protein [Thiohalocapsa marina]KAA6184011.1 hypothetical protein F2Q65_13725 [Thiohalocapsa marina]